ncbi:MAG: hypothetical protein Q8O15_06290 [Rectinemataceae bacterium]|nr:hypothetical protein [Rectinemataceae bacterium]
MEDAGRYLAIIHRREGRFFIRTEVEIAKVPDCSRGTDGNIFRNFDIGGANKNMIDSCR